MYTDCLRLLLSLFLVSVICPLMQHLLFDVHPFVTRTCNISDEAIFVLLAHTHDDKAIVIQFHFCLCTEIRKKFESLIILNITLLLSLLLLWLMMLL